MDEDVKLLATASDEQQAFVDQAALVAALDALKDYNPQEDSRKRMVHHILRAFAAALEMGRAAKLRVEQQSEGRVYLHLDIYQIVGSALRGRLLVPAVMPDPNSVAGAEMAAFVSACNLLEARCQYEAAMDCEAYGDIYGPEVLRDFKVGEEDE